MPAAQPTWSYGTLHTVAEVLADTDDGLTGREIGDLLMRHPRNETRPRESAGASGTSAASAHRVKA